MADTLTLQNYIAHVVRTCEDMEGMDPTIIVLEATSAEHAETAVYDYWLDSMMEAGDETEVRITSIICTGANAPSIEVHGMGLPVVKLTRKEENE